MNLNKRSQGSQAHESMEEDLEIKMWDLRVFDFLGGLIKIKFKLLNMEQESAKSSNTLSNPPTKLI